ncbi:MAG: CMD domain protein [Arachnia sp.]
MADIISTLAGLTPGSRVDGLRDLRPQARANAQLSFESLFEPADPGTFPLEERLAVALFVAGLHDDAPAAEFYADLLGDVASDDLVAAVRAAADATRVPGPTGTYREPLLAGESVPTTEAVLPEDAVAVLGARLTAGLAHAHLLVLHPRDARQSHQERLLVAGWSLNDIVTLSQAVAFLSFQLRAAAGLRVLAQEA